MRFVFLAGAFLFSSSLTFMLEPLFPLGDWRWAIVCTAGLAAMWWAYKKQTAPPSHLTPDQYVELEKKRMENQSKLFESLLMWALILSPFWFTLIMIFIRKDAE